jgi:hypothetical protein
MPKIRESKRGKKESRKNSKGSSFFQKPNVLVAPFEIFQASEQLLVDKKMIVELSNLWKHKSVFYSKKLTARKVCNILTRKSC